MKLLTYAQTDTYEMKTCCFEGLVCHLFYSYHGLHGAKLGLVQQCHKKEKKGIYNSIITKQKSCQCNETGIQECTTFALTTSYASQVSTLWLPKSTLKFLQLLKTFNSTNWDAILHYVHTCNQRFSNLKAEYQWSHWAHQRRFKS